MVVFKKPKSLSPLPFHYCPGCTHGIVHRLVTEAIDALALQGGLLELPRSAARFWHTITLNAT